MNRRDLLRSAPAAALLPLLPGAAQAASAQAKPVLRILLGGDTSFAESYHAEYAAAGGTDVIAAKGYDHSIGGLAPLLARADYTILNLETPLTPMRTSPLKGKDYLHWSDPDRATERLAAYGVDAVSLANNHTLDMGQEGLADTFRALRRYGLSWFGAGEDLAGAEQPLIRSFDFGDGRSFRLAVFGQFEHRTSYDRDYGFYAAEDRPGAATLRPERFASQAAALRETFPGIFIIAFPHWGNNYAWRSAEQAALGRALIDAGADMVIGHHGHTLQEIERYRDCWVLYGIGNFMFNSRGRYSQYPDVLPWSLAVELRIDEMAQLEGIALYPIASDNQQTGYRPTIAGEKEAVAVFQRLGALSSLGLSPTMDELGGHVVLAP